MPRIKYRPAGAIETMYRYEIGEIETPDGRRTAMVIFCGQDPPESRSAALFIEQLVTEIVRKLDHPDPSKIHYFENYPAGNGLPEWRRIAFKWTRPSRPNWIGRMLGRPSHGWFADEDTVGAVPDAITSQLRKILTGDIA